MYSGTNVPNVPRPRSGNDTKLNLLLPGEWLDDAQALAAKLSRPGVTMTRADVLRDAIRRGLDAIEAEARRR